MFYKLLLPKPDLVVLLEANENTRKLRKKDEFKNDTKKWKQVAKKINQPLLILQTDRENKDKIKTKIINKIFSSKNFYSNFLK